MHSTVFHFHVLYSWGPFVFTAVQYPIARSYHWFFFFLLLTHTCIVYRFLLLHTMLLEKFFYKSADKYIRFSAKSEIIGGKICTFPT